MTQARILWDLISDAAAYTNGGWTATLPLDNVAADDVRQVARSRSASPLDTQFRADLGMPQPVNAFWMRASLTASARIRFALSNTPSGGPYLIDSGWISALNHASEWGRKVWGAFVWGGSIDPDAYPSGPEVYWEVPDANSRAGRYLWCWVDDPGNPDGFIDIGRFLAGEAWSPPHNMNYGAAIDYLPMAQPKRTVGGRKLKPVAPAYREIALTFEHIPLDVANTTFATINQRLMNTGPLLVVYDPADDASYRYRRLVYGSVTKPGRIAETSFKRCSWSLTIEEDI